MSSLRLYVWDATGVRLAAGGLAGVAAAALVVNAWHLPAIHAAIIGWIAATAVFNSWTWARVFTLDASQTREHATREDAGALASLVIVLGATIAAVVAIGLLLAASSSHSGGADAEAMLAVLAIAGAWCTVHTSYMLHYARLYFAHDKPGIDFNDDDPPVYLDFAYLAFTIGMCYQVSDTNLKTKAIRHAALRHSLMSYVLGAIVIGATINLVSQLASASS